MKLTFQETFVHSAVMDGIIDIAYSFYAPACGPYESGSVYLPTDMAISTKVLIPEVAHALKFRDLDASVFSGSWFPFSSNFQTRNGSVGAENTFITLNHIGKVKCYSSGRKFSAFRGKTLYDTTDGWCLMIALKDTSKLRRAWASASTRRQIRRNNEPEELSKLRNHLETLIHDVERREHIRKNTPEELRLELTSRLDSEWSALDEPLRILRWQTLRNSLSDNELSAAEAYDIPWWSLVDMPLPVQVGEETGMQAPPEYTLPVVITSGVHVPRFAVAVEKNLLRLARSCFVQAEHLFQNDGNQERSAVTGFVVENPIFSFLRERTTPTIMVDTLLLISRSSIAAASKLVTSITCSRRTGEMKQCPFVLTATGMVATWYAFGYPCALLSRIMVLDDRVRRLVLRAPSAGTLLLSSLTPSGIRDEEDSLDFILASKGIHIPPHLFFTGSFQDDRVYGELMYNAPFEVSVSDEEGPYQNIARLISKIVQELFVAGGNDFDAENKSSFHALGSMLAVLTVSDICHDLSDRLKYGRRSNRPVNMQEKHRQRQNPTLTYYLLKELAELIEEDVEWPETYRLNGLLRPLRNEDDHQHVVEDLLTFYNGDMRLYSSLNNREKYRGFNVRQNGAMLSNVLIETMWKCAGTIDVNAIVATSHSRRRSSHREGWTSLVAMRILEDTLLTETRLSNHTRSTFLRDHFQRRMGTSFSMALVFAGFGVACPLIRVSMPSRETGICTMWDGKALTRLVKFGERSGRSNTRFVRVLPSYIDREGSSAAVQRRDWAINEKCANINAMSLSTLSRLKTYMRDMNAAATPALVQDQVEKYIEAAEEYLALPDIWEILGKILVTARQRLQISEPSNPSNPSNTITDNSAEWASDVLKALLKIRRAVGDEGAACILYANGSRNA